MGGVGGGVYTYICFIYIYIFIYKRYKRSDLYLFVFLIFKRCQIETLVFCLSSRGNLKKTAGGNAAPPGNHFFGACHCSLSLSLSLSLLDSKIEFFPFLIEYSFSNFLRINPSTWDN